MIKVLSRTPVLSAELFTVYEVKVELPSGEKHTYHDAVRHQAVSVFPITSDGYFYLIDQYRYIYDKRLIESVAGFIEEGESALDAAKRELKEETGLTADKWLEIGTVDAAGSIITWQQPLFVAQDLHLGNAHPEESEDIRVVKLGLSQAVELVMSGVIRTAPSVVGILMIDRLTKEGKILP